MLRRMWCLLCGVAASDPRILDFYGVYFAGCDGCNAQNASLCAGAPIATTMPCDTAFACARVSKTGPGFAIYSPGDLGTGKSRPNMSAYCSPDGSYAVFNVDYFLSPTCVDGFQIVTEPPSLAGVLWTFI